MPFQLVGLTAFAPLQKPLGLDISDGIGGYSSNVGVFPLPPEKLAKARQWTRALQRQIRATWWAAVETDTGLFKDFGVVPESEAVMVEAGLTVAAIQVLHEIFLSGYPRQRAHDLGSSKYESYAYQDSTGQVVSGLKLIRNGEMHADCIVIPDVTRVVSVSFEDDSRGFRVFPAWAEYGKLPTDVREARYPPARNAPQSSIGSLKTNQLHHDHYRAVVSGEQVVETFLDALQFFLVCDPRIARLDADGELVHFPLEPIFERDYERRHPDWPKRREMEDDLRQLCENGPPTGARRRIIAKIASQESGEILAYCGYTVFSERHSRTFTETPQQVARDIREHGYEYWTEDEGTTAPLIVNRGDVLDVDMDRAAVCDMPRPGEGQPPWRDLFLRSREDAFTYRDERRAR